MSVRGPEILRAATLPAVPWKNGGGVTTEIARHPPGNAASDFAWRVSLARIACDGPFSLYPGIDRTLAVVSGGGLSLEIAGIGSEHLTAASAPLAFAGELSVHGRLSAEPIDALNVMTRRHRIRHAIVPVTGPVEHLLATDVVATVLVAPVGPVDVDGSGSPGSLRLERGDALRFEEPAGRSIRIRPVGGSRAWLIVLGSPGVQPGAR